jgi:hypothetical protein
MVMNKRGTFLVYLAIVFVILVGFSAIFLKNFATKEVFVKVGAKEANMLSAYSEAEAVREYLKQSAEIAAAKAAKNANVKTGTNCFENLTVNINPSVNEEFGKFISSYKSPHQDSLVTLKGLNLDVIVENEKISITGRGEDILITSDKDKFEYSAVSDFKEDLTCGEYEKYYELLA